MVYAWPDVHIHIINVHIHIINVHIHIIHIGYT